MKKLTPLAVVDPLTPYFSPWSEGLMGAPILPLTCVACYVDTLLLSSLHVVSEVRDGRMCSVTIVVCSQGGAVASGW